MELEDVLPYHDFAIRIPYHVIYRLDKILIDLMQNENQVGLLCQNFVQHSGIILNFQSAVASCHQGHVRTILVVELFSCKCPRSRDCKDLDLTNQVVFAAVLFSKRVSLIVVQLCKNCGAWHTVVCLLQIRAMQERIACATQFLSYNEKQGRALEAVLCALRRKLFGIANVFPLMDWETCTLHCGFQTELPRHWNTGANIGRFSLADNAQRLELNWNHGWCFVCLCMLSSCLQILQTSICTIA